MKPGIGVESPLDVLRAAERVFYLPAEGLQLEQLLVAEHWYRRELRWNSRESGSGRSALRGEHLELLERHAPPADRRRRTIEYVRVDVGTVLDDALSETVRRGNHHLPVAARDRVHREQHAARPARHHALDDDGAARLARPPGPQPPIEETVRRERGREAGDDPVEQGAAIDEEKALHLSRE
jgi:hypothetical protein